MCQSWAFEYPEKNLISLKKRYNQQLFHHNIINELITSGINFLEVRVINNIHDVFYREKKFHINFFDRKLSPDIRHPNNQ